jgi:outer membrane murein-binding lipoprotein Lpp
VTQEMGENKVDQEQMNAFENKVLGAIDKLDSKIDKVESKVDNMSAELKAAISNINTEMAVMKNEQLNIKASVREVKAEAKDTREKMIAHETMHSIQAKKFDWVQYLPTIILILSILIFWISGGKIGGN